MASKITALSVASRHFEEEYIKDLKSKLAETQLQLERARMEKEDFHQHIREVTNSWANNEHTGSIVSDDLVYSLIHSSNYKNLRIHEAAVCLEEGNPDKAKSMLRELAPSR